MSDLDLKEYIVTLYRYEDLEDFYEDMETPGGSLYIPNRRVDITLRRPISRNTYYMLTEEEAELIKKDERVWDVVLKEEIKFKPRSIVNNSPYTVSGDFWKDCDSISVTEQGLFRAGFSADANKLQWGLLHCTGTQSQRRKNSNWGGSGNVESVNDSTTVFNDGKHVDVVIVDSPVPYDCEEFYSPTADTSRFVQYQWFTELNQYVLSIDDDGLSLPTGTITYSTNASIDPAVGFHGTLVASIVAGKYYGWSRESNIYNISVTDSWESGQNIGNGLMTFDYLRAFHLNKPINPETGFRNPTITNHSYGAYVNTFVKGDDENGKPIYSLELSDIASVIYQETEYNSQNPGPSGWSESGVEKDFGVRFGVADYPFWLAAIAADVQDCINDGIVCIGAAGNDNLLLAEEGDENWDNQIIFNSPSPQGLTSIYYNRGGAPNTPGTGMLQVGALSDETDFRRSTYTEFGPGVDCFAPGDQILGAVTDLPSYYRSALGVETGFEFLEDTKYTQGSGNWWFALDGTSFASPQVCGIIACAATNKPRFTQEDVKLYLQKNHIVDDMTFDVVDGNYDDPTCSKGSPNKVVLCKNPRDESGFINSQKGERKSTGMLFPRKNTLNVV
jgi:hypothetical protein